MYNIYTYTYIHTCMYMYMYRASLMSFSVCACAYTHSQQYAQVDSLTEEHHGCQNLRRQTVLVLVLKGPAAPYYRKKTSRGELAQGLAGVVQHFRKIRSNLFTWRHCFYVHPCRVLTVQVMMAISQVSWL